MSLLFEEKRKLAKWEPPVVHAGFVLPILMFFAIGLFYGPDIIDYVLYCMCNMVHMTITCAGIAILFWVAVEPAVHNAYYYFVRWTVSMFIDLDYYNDPDAYVRAHEQQVLVNAMAVIAPIAPVATAKYQSRCLYCHTSARKGTDHCGSCGAAL